jgi:mxaA protein
MRARAALAGAVALASTVAFAADADVALHPLRRFGYLIGDEVTVAATVRVPPGYTLDKARLPEPGRVNAFLELRGVTVAPARQVGGADASLAAARYLVVNSGTGVRTATTPPLELHFVRAGAPEVALRIPPVVFTVSALTPESVPNVEGLAEMQPDVAPPRLPVGALQARLSAYAGIAVLLAAWVAWLRGWLPRRWLGGRPFARALADLRRMRGTRAAEGQVELVRRLHRAFDEAAGFAVAGHSLERFFEARPWARALDAEIRAFFDASARVFYAGEAVASLPPDRVLRLAGALAAHEPKRVRG